MKTALKFILLFCTFSILFILPNVLFPLPFKTGSQSDASPILLFILLFTDLVFIVYLIKRLNLWGFKLFLAILIVFWGIQTLMTQLETWYFREVMPTITNGVLVHLFSVPFITSITFIPFAIWILGKRNQPQGQSVGSTHLIFNWKHLLALSVLYMIIYFVFGYYVAWQFQELRLFYSGSTELHGFFKQLGYTIHTKSLILPFQILRGFLFVLMGMPIVYYLKGNKKEKILALVFIYSIMPSIQLIIDNPFMPAEVRVAHFLEVSSSNGLFGLIVGIMSVRINDGSDPSLTNSLKPKI